MTNILNISGKIKPEIVNIYGDISKVATVLDIRFMVVGATARDIVMHYCYGAPIVRATRDVDFAVQVESAEEYEALKEELVKQSYSKTREPQRLLSNSGMQIDIIPFGRIENKNGDVLLPPDNTHQMSVLGFQEAFEYSDSVVIQDAPEIIVRVVSPVGFLLLKLIAWLDRGSDTRIKDALDIYYMFRNYESIDNITTSLYDNESEILEMHGWDVTKSATYLLGKNVANISSLGSKDMIASFVSGDLDNRDTDVLSKEMCIRGATSIEISHKKVLLDVFFEGFESVV